MGSRASGVQRDSSTPRSEGEARAELTQNVPNSSYEGKKKKQKSPWSRSLQSQRDRPCPRAAGRHPVAVACLCPLALNNNNNYKGRRLFGAGMA